MCCVWFLSQVCISKTSISIWSDFEGCLVWMPWWVPLSVWIRWVKHRRCLRVKMRMSSVRRRRLERTAMCRRRQSVEKWRMRMRFRVRINMNVMNHWTWWTHSNRFCPSGMLYLPQIIHPSYLAYICYCFSFLFFLYKFICKVDVNFTMTYFPVDAFQRKTRILMWLTNHVLSLFVSLNCLKRR